MEPPSDSEKQEVVKSFLGASALDTPGDTYAFLTFYQNVTKSQLYRWATCQVNDPLLPTHGHILGLVELLRANPQATRREFEAYAFRKEHVLEEELQHAVRLVVKIGFMLDPKPLPIVPVNISQQGIGGWDPDKSFLQFVLSILPKPKEEGFGPDDRFDSVWATKLESRCAVRFEKTDVISEHLLYNRKTKVLYLFHQMAYLRHQLEKHFQPPIDKNTTVEDCLKRGTLPPQLILEVLESFYEVLFPLMDDRSTQTKRLLQRLIRKKGFDPQSRQWRHNRFVTEDFEYLYLGERLKELAVLLRNPPPTSKWTAWLEERTQERNVMMIAIIGLFLSALFGLLGCILTAAQLWIAVLAWKYPPPS